MSNSPSDHRPSPALTAPQKPVHSASSERNDYIDFLKGCLIFLVLWGHCIQFVGYNNDRFWWDPVFKAIYMFHMPLFMAVSGYLCALRPNSSWRRLLSKRFQQWIVPMTAWLALQRLALVVALLFALPSAKWHVVFRRLPDEWQNDIVFGYWFLWALFLATALVAFLQAIRRDGWPYLLVACCLILFLPSGGIDLFKYTLPFYCLAYVAGRRSWPAVKGPWLLGLGLALSAALYVYWKPQYYIYTSGMVLDRMHLGWIAYRWVAALVASGTFLLLAQQFFSRWQPLFVARLGRRTLDVYLLQFLFFPWLTQRDFPLRNSAVFALAVAPVLAVGLAAGTVALGRFLRRSSGVARYLFGQLPRQDIHSL